ncbi:hypothetical protein D3C71_1810140 [compost metagenome]
MLYQEPGIIMMGRRIFMAPQATGPQVDHLRDAVADWDLQAQIKHRAHHHRQLADEHQPVFADTADRAHGLVGDAVEYFQKTRQLVPLDPAFCEHAGYRFARTLG